MCVFVIWFFRKPIASRILLPIVPGVSKGSTFLEVVVFWILLWRSMSSVCRRQAASEVVYSPVRKSLMDVVWA